MYPIVDGSTRAGKAVYAVLSGLTRKVKAGYAVRDGVHRQFYSVGAQVAYSGTHTITDVMVGGVACKLYTLTGSGTLTVKGGEVQYWMCGGGAGGLTAKNGSTNEQKYSGPGGAGGYTDTGTLDDGTYAVVIGSGGTAGEAGGNTTLGAYAANGAEKTVVYTSSQSTAKIKGASGGGGASTWPKREISTGITATTEYYAMYSNGQGVSTYPFGLEALKAHSAGGGGGGYALEDAGRYLDGGSGGTNGGNGGNKTRSSGTTSIGGTGGDYGGGTGGFGMKTSTGKYGSNGYAATFYGAGGGGGGYHKYSSTYHLGKGGAGYQGVVYVLQEA